MEQRFVIDTNGWVSIFYKKVLDEFIERIIEKDVLIFSCNELINEFKDIHSKHAKIKKMLPHKTAIYVEAILNVSETFEPQPRYRLLNDYKDNYLVDIAHQTRSGLVTNDKGFDYLKKFRSPKIKIITLGVFYKRIGL